MRKHFLAIWLLPAALSASAGEQLAEPPLRTAQREHWAFVKCRRPAIPDVPAANPIDAFIQNQLNAAGLRLSEKADKLTLLRRAAFDLTGLPPTAAEVAAFAKDDRVDAYERAVDRLLASPHFGERWAQHWLDVVRYAESNGYENDAERPSAWRYRDYVIRAFNEDKPFDRFVREQVAGDLLASGNADREHADLWIATGFNRCGPAHVVAGNVDPEETRQEFLSEAVTGVGAAFLGLTVQCARCHDHKFDPISQADYYRLTAFYGSTSPKDLDYGSAEQRSAYQIKLLANLARLAPFKARVAAIDAPYEERIRAAKIVRLDPAHRAAVAVNAKERTEEQQALAREVQPLLKVTWDEILAAMAPADRQKRATLRAEQHAVEAELPLPPAQAWAIAENDKPRVAAILKRGELKNKGAIVGPDLPRLFQTTLRRPRDRKDLADWLTSSENPLTARVFVNRVWQHHFGRGLVATVNDFGMRGQPPTHPDLLDWLASDFMEKGWRVKELHRLIVLSQTYRQTSAARTDTAGQHVDPENKLLWRMNRRRLDGEAIRDAMLAAAGTLNPELDGPMIRVPLEPEVYNLIFTEGEPDGLWPVTPDVKQHTRRSIYLFAKRNVRQPLLEAFDQPDRLSPCAVRPVSTFSPQALILMNGPLARSQSQAFAERLLQEAPGRPGEQIELAYRRGFGRPPTEVEVQLGQTFLREQQEIISKQQPNGAARSALADYCLALFNSNEFVYVR